MHHPKQWDSQVKLNLIILCSLNDLLPQHANSLQILSRNGECLDEVLGLLFLCELMIELVSSDFCYLLPHFWESLDEAIHFFKVSQLQALLIAFVKRIVSLHQLLSEHQHSHPSRINLNSYLLCLGLQLCFLFCFKLDHLQTRSLSQTFIER